MRLSAIYEQIAGMETKEGLPEYRTYHRKDLCDIPIDMQIKIVNAFESLIAYETILKDFEFDRNSSQKSMEKLSDYVQGDSILVTSVDIGTGDLIGTVILRPMIVGNINVCVLTFVNITEPYRYKGYGTLLMAKVDKIAKSLKCQTLWLSVVGNNTSAIGFYQELGFETTALHMAKDIK